MTSRERFFSALTYRGYDRPPTHFYATPEIAGALKKRLDVATDEELLDALGDDMRPVDPDYCGADLGRLADGSSEYGLWGERYALIAYSGGAYRESCELPFAGVEDVAQLANKRFPSAEQYDYGAVAKKCARHPDRVRTLGDAGDPDFINGIARCRSVEQVLIDIATEDPVYLELVRRQFEFVYERNERALRAANGLIDVVCFGEDLGDQRSLILRPESYDRLFAPYMERLFAQAHRHGALTMMHSCGSVRGLIPRLIELGLDILEVVQVDAAGMDIASLHQNFYGRLAFCGSVSVQSTLPFGSEEDVREAVRLRKRLFAQGGMIIAPTHCIQPGTPLENILAMYDEIGSLNR